MVKSPEFHQIAISPIFWLIHPTLHLPPCRRSAAPQGAVQQHRVPPQPQWRCVPQQRQRAAPRGARRGDAPRHEVQGGAVEEAPGALPAGPPWKMGEILQKWPGVDHKLHGKLGRFLDNQLGSGKKRNMIVSLFYFWRSRFFGFFLGVAIPSDKEQISRLNGGLHSWKIMELNGVIFQTLPAS